MFVQLGRYIQPILFDLEPNVVHTKGQGSVWSLSARQWSGSPACHYHQVPLTVPDSMMPC